MVAKSQASLSSQSIYKNRGVQPEGNVPRAEESHKKVAKMLKFTPEINCAVFAYNSAKEVDIFKNVHSAREYTNTKGIVNIYIKIKHLI